MTKTKGIIMGAGIAGFVFIAYFVVTRDVLTFDTVIREWFYSIRNDILTPILKVITYMGNWESITLLCIILLFFRKTRMRYGMPVSAGAIFVTLLNKGIKIIFKRPRPDVSLHLIDQGGYSFTSGHAITSMVVFGLMIYLVRKYTINKRTADILTGLLAIPWIFIGLSRIYMGVHFPTDVLAGWCLGAAILMVIITIEQKVTKKENVLN